LVSDLPAYILTHELLHLIFSQLFSSVEEEEEEEEWRAAGWMSVPQPE